VGLVSRTASPGVSAERRPIIHERRAGAVQNVRAPLLTRSQKERLVSIASPVGLLVLWELLVKAGLLNAKFFPAPTDIMGTFWGLLTSGVLLHDVYISLYRILAGFLLGGIPGILIGLTMGLFPAVRMVLDPVVAATYPIPKLALLPLFMLIFGLGNTEMIVVIAAGAIFLTLMNTAAGVLNLDRVYWDVAKNFGASKLDQYRTVAIPGALPLIFTGLKLAMGMAILLIVAAESDGANHGIGFLIWRSYQLYEINGMYVAFVMIALVGWVFTALLDELERIIVPWKS
jgi:NitT/TauT family transport system permease protein